MSDRIRRLWERDASLWSTDAAVQESIRNRLGWLGSMSDRIDEVLEFADEVRGFDRTVVLGMGGSSLCAEVIAATMGRRELRVLDSTHPEAVRAIDPEGTLFVVASKSGETIETLSLYRYFSERADRRQFVVITDPGTRLARADVRRVFLNPPDIGGRYSALSYFGLVPAALCGADVRKLVADAEAAREECRVPGCVAERLGVAMGEAALEGRDKLVLPDPVFGAWAEQLVAESTGKDGKGILPIVGERSPKAAGDRFFIGPQGFDYEFGALGADFFRWMVATAIAGAVIGVNPFDEPNVAEAKAATARVLAEGGTWPPASTIEEVEGATRNGEGVAILAFVHRTPGREEQLAELRDRFEWATVGYGPRYLHSTGQFHKGGPDVCVFMILTEPLGEDLPIPGEPYTFGRLLEAQALGDYLTLRAHGRRVFHVELDPV